MTRQQLSRKQNWSKSQVLGMLANMHSVLESITVPGDINTTEASLRDADQLLANAIKTWDKDALYVREKVLYTTRR